MKIKNLFKVLTLPTALITPIAVLSSCNLSSVLVTSITISGANSVGVGGEIQLKATVKPDNAKNKEVTWSVSDTNVATITEDGLLTGVAKGSVTVTATAKDGSGIKGTKNISVTAPVLVESISISKKAIPTSVEVGSSTKLNLTVLPSDATNKNVTWTVTPSNVASIDSNGVLVGLSAGTATVTAKAKDTSGVSSNTITVSVTAATTTTDNYDDYIFDRTFTIAGWGSAGSVHGTGWILSDATPNDSTDYEYYVATNWHVIKGMEYYGTTNKYTYGCKYSSSTYVKSSNEIQFTSFQPLTDTNFTYDGKTKITIKEPTTTGYVTYTGLQGCDIYVAKANFASCKTSSSPCASITKDKLDRLNQLTAAGKKITDVAIATTDSTHYENYDLYTGGYPVGNLYGPTWQCHDLSDEDITLTYHKRSTSSSYEYAHSADSFSSPLIDCTPQYADDTGPIHKNWMMSGASGSMMIADFGDSTNHNWKVVGIYWGGQGYEDSQGNEYIYPFFSIFNSNWRNYVGDWM